MSALITWQSAVQAHLTQVDRARAALTQAHAFTQSVPPAFRADPHRTGDPEVEAIAAELTPDSTVIDVGGGAGRLALATALHCKHVTLVEPSERMVAGFRESAERAGIRNVSVVQSRWMEAEGVEPADVVMTAHGFYTTPDIVPFVRKLETHARHKVLMFANFVAPTDRYAPFWQAAHGQPMVQHPGAKEFLPVLWDMGIYPDVHLFPALVQRPLRDWNDVVETLRWRVLVDPGTEADERMQAAARELVEETPQGWSVKGDWASRVALISWAPRAK